MMRLVARALSRFPAFVIGLLPIKVQALIAINKALRLHGHTSHFRLEAYRYMRASSGLPLSIARVFVDDEWPSQRP